MPDWFYRTVAQRVLFRSPDEPARTLALGLIGTLGRSRPGRAIIEFMGHMAPDPRLAVRLGTVEMASPIGFGWRVDPEQRAIEGLSCFGVGCIEIVRGPTPNVSRGEGESLLDGGPSQARAPRRKPCAATAVSLERSIAADGSESLRLPAGLEVPVFGIDAPPADKLSGVLLQVGSRLAAGRWRVPARMPETLPHTVLAWRRMLPDRAPLIVAGGVAEPSDAVALLDAGATLILLDAGLVFHGPGLVKRCNEALASRLPAAAVAPSRSSLFRSAWFWALALGAALALGGTLTLGLALTRVLLPYDEAYLGFTSAELHRSSPRLFAFMAHDRGTLAGTMLGLGWLYVNLAWSGLRQGRHGARTAVVASALAGFASFFAFFGFGYFDTLHAFVAAILFQLTVQIMVGSDERTPAPNTVVDNEDAAWRRAQWAQLCWVVHAVGLLIAGVTILGIGTTSVFVREDLNFLCVTADQVQNFGARLFGVVAHDRATLGGMLLSSGVAMLLPVLWCFRRGARWLWRAIAGLGLPAYAAALGVHLWVGYTDWHHLVPALSGLALWLGGLILGRAYLATPARRTLHTS